MLIATGRAAHGRMPHLVHRQMQNNGMVWMKRSGMQASINGVGATYVRSSIHRSSVIALGKEIRRSNRTRAQERSDQGASAASSAPQTSAATSQRAAGTAEGAPSPATNGIPSNINTARDVPTFRKEKASSTNSGNKKEDDDEFAGFSMVDIATSTSFVEKIAGALVMYGLTVLLSSLSDVDATRGMLWNDGVPLAIGAATAAPVMLAVGLLFLPSLDVGFKLSELRTVSEVDQDEDAAILDLSGGLTGNMLGSDGEFGKGKEPPITSEALKRGLWLYQVHVLKPWYPSFRWSSVGFLYLASCAAAGAQELLVRGYGGALLTGWYNNLLASTTDVNNPIYWAKVFKLVTSDTARWLAAFSLIALQVLLSGAAASRASSFARTALNRVGRVPSEPLVKGVVVQNVRLTLELGGKAEPVVEGEDRVTVEVPTPEDRVVYWASLGVSILLCGAVNCAWAASGSLLGSYTAQVVIDGVVTGLQQLKATQLTEKELWEQIQQEQEEEGESESDTDGQ
ncbi:hypothetical protein Vafri_12869 [Volvox africanus]|uniref:Uncharacterized protein n=1 Tax=Volvox africanus TaxID=51714 RepID=A0A8J4BB26_9CHLO|nr:hypothetical protein Vafri_12869 [Volvox africanus]